MRLFAIFIFGLFLVSCTTVPAPTKYEDHVASLKHFPTSAGQMAYADQGEGEVVVLMHGVPTSSWVYRKVAPQLAKNFRVISPDFIGFGSSAKPDDDGKLYAPAEQAKRVRALMKSLNIQRYSLAMHDMGGLVAWEMLRQDRKDSKAIQDLIVFNTIIHKDGFYPPHIEPNKLNHLLLKAYSSNWSSDAILGMTFKNLGLKNANKLSKDECYGYVEPIKQGSDKAIYAFFTSLNDSLFKKLDQNQTMFKTFPGRTLVLWGGEDKILTTKQIPFLAKHLNIPKEDVHIYPEHDHFLAEEIPQEVSKQITNFLQR